MQLFSVKFCLRWTFHLSITAFSSWYFSSPVFWKRHEKIPKSFNYTCAVKNFPRLFIDGHPVNAYTYFHPRLNKQHASVAILNTRDVQLLMYLPVTLDISLSAFVWERTKSVRWYKRPAIYSGISHSTQDVHFTMVKSRKNANISSHYEDRVLHRDRDR